MSNNKRKRVGIIYSNRLRNDGSPLYYWNQLKKREDIEVLHLLPEGDVRKFGKMDLWLWVDYGEDGFDPVGSKWLPPQDGGKHAYVASDTHLGREYRFEKAKHFDYVFFNQKRAVEEYTKSKRNKKVIWLPHAAEPQAYPKIDIIKKWDVCFIGHLQDQVNCNGFTRVDALDRLFKEFPNFYYGTRTPLDPTMNLFEDVAKKFSQSRIVFNVSIRDDINMRVFEALATNSLLLTNYVPTLSDVFTDGMHLVTYKTLDEMIEKATYFINHEEARELIAQQGYDEVIKKHTYQKRLETILEVCL